MLTLIQNDQQVPSGNFLDWLRTLDLPVRIIEAYLGEELPSVDDSSAVIVLGGAMGVHDSSRYPYLLTVKSYIQQVVLREVPLLGICLGGQLLADVLGATVHSRKNGEMGLLSVTVLESAISDPLFHEIPQSFTSFQWHNDSFEIPTGAICLASSPDCAHQAFRYGANQYGLQFHPEVSRDIVSRWIDSSADLDDFTWIIDDFIRHEALYSEVSRKILENFLRIAGMLR